MTDISRSQAWLESLRPKTLPLAFAAIIVGTVLAWEQGHFDPWVALLALITAGLLQILSNLANDYGDAVKGSDKPDRIGPLRGMQKGVITPQQMKRALIDTVVLICLFGLALFNLLALHSAWGWLFILATPLLVKQARYVLRESDPLAMRPMLEKTVKGALLTNLLFVIGIIASKLTA